MELPSWKAVFCKQLALWRTPDSEKQPSRWATERKSRHNSTIKPPIQNPPISFQDNIALSLHCRFQRLIFSRHRERALQSFLRKHTQTRWLPYALGLRPPRHNHHQYITFDTQDQYTLWQTLCSTVYWHRSCVVYWARPFSRYAGSGRGESTARKGSSTGHCWSKINYLWSRTYHTSAHVEPRNRCRRILWGGGRI